MKSLQKNYVFIPRICMKRTQKRIKSSLKEWLKNKFSLKHICHWPTRKELTIWKREPQFEFRIPRVSRRLALVQLARFNEVHLTDGVVVDVTNLNYFCPSSSLRVFVSFQLFPLVFSYLQDKDISLSFDLLYFYCAFLIVAIKESYLAEVHTKIS